MAAATDQQFHDLVAGLKQALGADRCTLYLLDQEKGEVWSKVALGLEIPEIRLRIHRGLVGYVARTGQILNLKDAYNDPRFERSVDQATGYRTKSILTMGIRGQKHQVIGVLQALNKPGVFTSEDEELMRQACLEAARLIES